MTERDEPFDKHMHDADWVRVFARQAMRTTLLDEWFDALALTVGSRLADLGCGPGYVCLRAANRVGALGRVFAVDRSADALDMLRGIVELHALQQVEIIESDAATIEALPEPVNGAILANMLHHNDDPGAILARAAAVAGDQARILVAEFHPDAPCTIGPPADVRIGPETVAALARDAGLQVIRQRRQSAEHYFTVVTR